jgi:hypothetical protein
MEIRKGTHNQRRRLGGNTPHLLKPPSRERANHGGAANIPRNIFDTLAIDLPFSSDTDDLSARHHRAMSFSHQQSEKLPKRKKSSEPLRQ